MDAAGTTRNRDAREAAPGLFVFPDAAAVARAAAERFAALAAEAAEHHGEFNVALAGGSTPLETYRLLASADYRERVPWPQVRIFFGDERHVSPDHPASNYGAAERELLAHVPIPRSQVHRMAAEREPMGRAAHAYEQLLAEHLPRGRNSAPRLDLVLLGLGDDGHTASLFPGAPSLAGTSRWVVTPWVEKLAQRRMTLTLSVLNAAAEVLFLVTGAGKSQALARMVAGDPAVPAALVVPLDGQRLVFADAAAALPGTAR
jgi:6-phosphogluconolactonase